MNNLTEIQYNYWLVTTTMKNKTFLSWLMIFLIIIVLLLILTGGFLLWLRSNLVIEQQQQPESFHSIPITENLQIISPENGDMLEEIAVLVSPHETSGVVGMIQSKVGFHLLVIYSDGIFRRWDMDDLKVVSEYDFSQASSRSVNFSDDGELVITPGKVISSSATTGYTIWNTSSGTMVKCWGAHCPNGDPDAEKLYDFGLVLDPSKKWIVEYGGQVIGADGLTDPMSVLIDLYDDMLDLDYDVRHLVFDSSGKYIAYAIKEGEVKIIRTDDLLGQIPLPGPSPRQNYTYTWKRRKTYGLYNQNSNIETIDLGIDPTGKWLAWLTKDELTVWDLNKTVFARAIHAQVDNGTTIEFNRNGNLLAIGTNNGIVLFDLRGKKKMAELLVGKVTALYLSLDNRMLIWGDTQGVIHLWGVK